MLRMRMTITGESPSQDLVIRSLASSSSVLRRARTVRIEQAVSSPVIAAESGSFVRYTRQVLRTNRSRLRAETVCN